MLKLTLPGSLAWLYCVVHQQEYGDFLQFYGVDPTRFSSVRIHSLSLCQCFRWSDHGRLRVNLWEQGNARFFEVKQKPRMLPRYHRVGICKGLFLLHWRKRSINTLTGVRGWPVSTRVMTDTSIANGTEVYSKAARADRTLLFVRIIFISSLETK